MSERVQRKGSEMFLHTHLPDCTVTEPCPTCRAVALLKEHELFDQFLAFKREFDNAATDETTRILDMSVVDFIKLNRASPRLGHALFFDGPAVVRTVRDICSRTERKWLITPGLGRRTMDELKEMLAKYGLKLGMDV